MKNYKQLTTVALLLFSFLLCYPLGVAAQKNELKFKADGTFKIVQLTDIHYVYQNKSSEEAMKRIIELLKQEQPDLILLTGDMIYGKPGDKSFLTVMHAMSSLNIPFAYTYGNHDDEQGLTRAELYKLAKDVPYNITSTTPKIHGVTNYTLEIKGSQDNKVAEVLYIIDSNSYSQIEGVGGYDYIKTDQIEWYKKMSKKYSKKNNNQPVPALAFFHIPTPEFKAATRLKPQDLKGHFKEEICSPQLNSGLVCAMKEQGDVRGIFVGHDHDNDFVVDWYGILLAYGRYSGGKTVYNNLDGNGMRVIELNEDSPAFNTWVATAKEKFPVYNYPADFIKEK